MDNLEVQLHLREGEDISVSDHDKFDPHYVVVYLNQKLTIYVESAEIARKLAIAFEQAARMLDGELETVEADRGLTQWKAMWEKKYGLSQPSTDDYKRMAEANEKPQNLSC